MDGQFYSGFRVVIGIILVAGESQGAHGGAGHEGIRNVSDRQSDSHSECSGREML